MNGADVACGFSCAVVPLDGAGVEGLEEAGTAASGA